MAVEDEDLPARPGAPVPEDRAALIHAIYRIALEPQSYDRFMQHWNDHISGAIAALSSLQDQADLDDPAIVGHFETAFGILEELGRRPSEPLHEGRGARLLLGGDGAIAWCNAAAAQLFELPQRAGLAALESSLSHARPLRRLLAGLGDAARGGEPQSSILRYVNDRAAGYMLARRIEDRSGRAFVLLEPLLGDWPPALDRLLADAFDLTGAETRVAAALAQGRTATAIAAERGVSVLTVRTQIRALLAKTGAANQTDLVRLLISAARAFDRTTREADAPAAPIVCVTAKGREVPIALMGPPGGFPVIFFHGMLDGCSATSRIEAALAQAGLRLVAPIRPGFGSAAPDTGPPATAARRFAEDVEGVLDRLRLDRVVLLGHMAGALYAFAAAARLKARVLGIVNVAGTVPIVSTSQFACMSRRQRLVAYTARYAPAALPFVLRAGIRQLDFDGERNFMTALYDSSPRDLAAIEGDEVFRSLRRGYRFTVAQGHRAFETDGYQVVRDWSDLAAASAAPVTLLHGHHDPVVTADAVSAFALRLGPRAKVRLFDDCGQLLLYTAPEAVCRAVRAHVDAGAGATRASGTAR